ncbi:hypothetical protein DFH08DRAFT_1088244 [Mycena albidolilacea]|uniref:DUF6589 domain-containing protein n=1 Tax=Mycena albidolilacea TaxID=1033008 RepID=A0AAD7EBE1_9AGAR|nr:hypothetical protein DFH08DRAFT_1088244 [Mycena albidolilacea]
MDGNPQQPPVKLVRSYQRHPPPEIIPVITSFASASTPGSPVTPSPSSASIQPSLRAARRTKWQKVDDVLKTYGFPNLGDFLACLFHLRTRGEKDHRTQRHRQAVGAFLQGKCAVKMADLIESLYHHHKSRPKKDSEDYHSAFSPNKPLTEIQCARPCLSAWATRLVGNHAYFRVGKLARKNRVGGSRRRHLRATTNGRPELKETLLDNWLFNLRGEAGNFIEGDLMQEWNNRWLEDIAGRCGGEFDDQFYRKTVAPNVLHFLKMKEDIETAFDLKRRGKAHTSPHLRNETQILLCVYEDEELHSFRSGRSMGHAAVTGLTAAISDWMKENWMSFFSAAQKLNSRMSSPNPCPDSPQTTRPSSRRSARSTASKAASLAADSVEGWDDEDHSDEVLVSCSDSAVSTDPETGRLCDDWYEPAEFEALLEQMFGPEEEGDEESEDEEPESEETASESEGE